MPSVEGCDAVIVRIVEYKCDIEKQNVVNYKIVKVKILACYVAKRVY